MTTILVTGGSGLLGGHLLARPVAPGVAIRAISRRPRPAGGPNSPITWLEADLATGDGLDAAMANVDVIIHAASSPARDTRRVDVEGAERLLASAARAGVRHIVHVSIVGIDRIPVAYYRHKLAAEDVIRSGEVPWTIVRGTQFHDFMDRVCRRLTALPVAIVPAAFRVQPIHVAEFADVLWRAAEAPPAHGIREAGGPEVLTWREMAVQWMTAHGRRKPVLRLPIPGRAAAALRRGDGTCPGHAVGTVSWAAWLQRNVRGQAASAPPLHESR